VLKPGNLTYLYLKSISLILHATDFEVILNSPTLEKYSNVDPKKMKTLIDRTFRPQMSCRKTDLS
jgi:hypothetical protein